MSDSIELLEPERFIPNDLRRPNITIKPKKERRFNIKAASIYQNANKRVATESVDHTSANNSMRPGNEFNPSHRLSMRLDGGKWPSRVSSRLDNGLPTDEQSFPNLKGRLEILKERKMNVDTDNLQFIKFLKYGVRRDHNEWSFPRSFGNIKIFNKQLNCSVSIFANPSSNHVVNLPEDKNQSRLKDRFPDERKYVKHNHKLNALIKAHLESWLPSRTIQSHYSPLTTINRNQ